MMAGSNSHLEKNTDTVSPMEQGNEEEASPEATRQQKLIKAGLLAVLAAIVVYVVLDYTVSVACHTTAAVRNERQYQSQ